MIKELLLYFAGYVDRQVMTDCFRNGSSRDTEYADMQSRVHTLPLYGHLPEIRHIVFGDSLEKVRRTINGFTGLYLFIDYGTIVSTLDSRQSCQDTLSCAVTVAGKISDQADLVEEQLLSDRTLALLNRLRARMVADSARYAWLTLMSGRHQMDPFVSPELKSIGWTLTFSIDAQDLLNVKELILQYRNENQN